MTNLAELVPDRAILLDVDADDSDALIVAMSEALADAGIVERDYAERCIARERTNPTGLVTAAGSIALPHADPREGEKMGIAVARPSSPVEFGAMADEGTVDAKVVFLLAVAGGEAHLDALAEVIDIVQDPDRMAGLLTAQEPEDVKQLLRRNPR
ncbi:MAG TPA: PTS sugar transporter subunit IIA [Acidimicrobiia bacterium]|nr:PTS sugar transporter subunit IIA [Acidimicrobiia bacterium]